MYPIGVSSGGYTNENKKPQTPQAMTKPKSVEPPCRTHSGKAVKRRCSRPSVGCALFLLRSAEAHPPSGSSGVRGSPASTGSALWYGGTAGFSSTERFGSVVASCSSVVARSDALSTCIER